MTTDIQPAIKTYKYTHERQQCSLYVQGGWGFPVSLNAEETASEKEE
jgi:hypothetical protein